MTEITTFCIKVPFCVRLVVLVVVIVINSVGYQDYDQLYVLLTDTFIGCWLLNGLLIQVPSDDRFSKR